MRKDTGSDRSISAIVVVALHLALGWWLLTQASPEPRRGAESALRIHWIAPPLPPPPSPAPPPEREPRAEPPPSATPRITPPPRAMTVVELPPVPTPSDAASLPSADALIEQGRRWAGAQAGDHDFRRDPLRPAAPAAATPERFRMRPPPSPAQVLESIGRLVNGPDYESDPCPRVRRNLAGLGPGGDSALVQEEIRRLQRLCQ